MPTAADKARASAQVRSMRFLTGLKSNAIPIVSSSHVMAGAQDERWRTMANVGCFSYTAGAGLFTSGGNGHPDTSPGNQHPCNEIAFVPLSNQLVVH